MKRPARYALILMAVSAVMLALIAFGCARALAHRERVMRDDEAGSARLVTYLLLPGESLRVPVDPRTGVLRVVAHAFRRGSLGAASHHARWRIGSGATLEIVAPGLTERAHAEEPGIEIGDPVAFNVDAREQAPELSLGLDAISDADGMLLRVYRRETSFGVDQPRGDTVSFEKRENLAVRSGELDWIDLPGDERAVLIGARWEKVAPLPSQGHPLQAVAIALSPPTLSPVVPPAAAGPAARRREQLPSTVEYDRIVQGHPMIVQALDAAIVLRVQVRRPFVTSEPRSARLGMLVDITQDGRTVTFQADATVQPSSQDVYEAPADGKDPSESTTFFALIPARGRGALRATATALDVVLSELDPQASERRFVGRRPTNWQTFEAQQHGALRLAHRAPPVLQPHSFPGSLLRVARPQAVAVTKSHGLSFVPASTAIPFESHAASEILSIRLLVERPTDIRVLVDGGDPRRRKSGIARAVTTTRVIHVDGEARVGFVVGDDLEPGRHILSFQAGGAACSVHLPWAKRARAEPETSWVSGELEP